MKARDVNVQMLRLLILWLLLTATEPTFTQSSPVYISENTVVGTSVAVVSLTHDDGGDLIVYPPSSPYFDYNSTSGSQVLFQRKHKMKNVEECFCFVCIFPVHSKNFHSYADVTLTAKGLQI